MCSLAHPRGALGVDATAFLDRRRGVAAVAPGVMARQPSHHVGVRAAAEGFSGLTHKRARTSFESNVVTREGLAAGEPQPVSIAPAPTQTQQQRLQDRMKAELEALRDLHRKALLLCRGDAHTAKGEPRFSAAALRRQQEAPLEAAAKRSKTSPSKPATEAAYQIKAPVKVKPQAPAPAQRAAPPQEQGCLVTSKAREILKKRRQEEIARAREKCRQEVLEIERTKLPDETISPKDLEELGISPFEFVVTRTRKQAERDGAIPCRCSGHNRPSRCSIFDLAGSAAADEVISTKNESIVLISVACSLGLQAACVHA